MADSSTPPSRKGIEKLKEEITCPICLEIYEEPKVLPCLHIYCKECLRKLVRKSGNQTVTCPECRSVAQILDDNLQTAHPIQRLKEIYETMLQASQTSICTSHQNQPAGHYCKNCEKKVCRCCILAQCQRKGHIYDCIGTVATEYRETMFGNLASTKQLQMQVSTALTKVTKIKNQIREQKDTLTRDISSTFDRMIDVLQDKRQKLLQNLSEITEEKEQIIGLQEQQLQAAEAELTQFVESTMQTIAAASDERILSHKQETIADINEVTHRLSQISQSPADKPNVAMSVTNIDKLRTLCETSCSIYCKTVDPSKCTAAGEGLRHAETGKMATFTVHLVDSKGDSCIKVPIVTAELEFARKNLAQSVQVLFTSAAQCEVFFQSEFRGIHTLSVKVDDISIPNSPFQVVIQKPLDQMQVPLTQITTVQNPTRLAYGSEKLYICNSCKQGTVSVLDQKCNMITMYINPLNSPIGVAIDQHFCIYASTNGDNKVHKFTNTGAHVKTIGGYGKAHEMFINPNGIRISTNNRLFVCDSGNNRIQVFDIFLRFLKVIGKAGNRAGVFNFPADLDLDDSGKMYVADCNNHRIQVMTQDGDCEFTMGTKGTAPGELYYPTSVQVKNKLLYVTEKGNHRVSVFHILGYFITTIGNASDLHEPEGITIDEDGFVHVSSTRRKIVVF